ncbi:MAG: GNAT family N-acetyltransferase [Lacrimispora sp.]|uniref:GNAT family N-acetyltransferase n=1 Tax=Lacrimispora sp. TaxID=2719234 RepID=UPI0039E5B508
MEFLIEKAVTGDHDILAGVIREVWLQMERKEWFVADDSKAICQVLKEGRGLGYKAFEKESKALAGVFIAVLPGKGKENLGRDIGLADEELEKVAHMETIAILPQYRGNGLQHTMMQAAEEELKSRGYKYFMCTIHPENIYSEKNAVKQGYEVVLTKEKYGGYVRDILLKRR